MAILTKVSIKFINRFPQLREAVKRSAVEAAERAADLQVQGAKDDLANKAKHPHAVGALADAIHKERGEWKGLTYEVPIVADKPYAWQEERRGNGAHSYMLSQVVRIAPIYGGILSGISRREMKKIKI